MTSRIDVNHSLPYQPVGAVNPNNVRKNNKEQTGREERQDVAATLEISRETVEKYRESIKDQNNILDKPGIISTDFDRLIGSRTSTTSVMGADGQYHMEAKSADQRAKDLISAYNDIYDEIIKGYEDGTRETYVADKDSEKGYRKLTKEEEINELNKALANRTERMELLHRDDEKIMSALSKLNPTNDIHAANAKQQQKPAEDGYSKLYKGAERINSYGTGSNAKTSLVRYEFNITDEDGNKIMDKMSKEETMRTMNEIRSYYGDDIIVEFSGDGLAQLVQGKMADQGTYERKTILEDAFIQLEGPKELSEEAKEEIRNAKHGDDMEDLMRRADPDAYKEYMRLKDFSNSPEAVTMKDKFAYNSYMNDWVVKRAKSDSNWIDRTKREDGTSKKSEDNKDKAILDNLSKKFKNVSFSIGKSGKFNADAGKEYSIILSDEEMDVLKNGTDEEKEKLYKTIDESLKQLSDMKEKVRDNDLFGAFAFGLSISAKAGTNESILSFLAQFGDKSYSASSTDELIKLINGSKSVDYRV